MARPADAVAEQRVPLSKERVLRTAIRLADESGIEALTMRRLAQELGVEAMSLYYYFPSKEDILAGIVEMAESEIELPTGGADWKSALRRSAISHHDMLKRHPWAATGLVMTPKNVGRARLKYMEAVLGRLREAGFTANMTHHAYHALDSHITGSTLWAAGFTAIKDEALDVGTRLLRELPRDEFRYFIEHAEQHLTKPVRDGINTFEFGLDLILQGLERILHARARRSASARRKSGRT